MNALGTNLTLRLSSGKQRGHEIHVDVRERFLIGRDSHCRLRLRGHNNISRVHCVIEHQSEGFVVRDCMSKNGTFLNDRRLSTIPTTLHTGDMLHVGPFFFEVDISTEVKRQPPPEDGSTIDWLG